MIKAGESPCTLSFLASCYEVGFLEHTIRHVVRACHYPFVEKLLNIDIESGQSDKLRNLRRLGQKLIAD